MKRAYIPARGDRQETRHVIYHRLEGAQCCGEKASREWSWGRILRKKPEKVLAGKQHLREDPSGLTEVYGHGEEEDSRQREQQVQRPCRMRLLW